MKALKLVIIILFTCLIAAGCSSLRSDTPAGNSTEKDDIRLSTGKATLAESLEKSKPLVDLSLEE